MSSNRQITGGTNDVNPQMLTIALTASGANTYTEAEVALPVNRFAQKSGKSIVVELLKIIWDLPEADANPTAPGSLLQAFGQLSTISQVAITSASPRVFAFAQKIIRGAFTAAGTYACVSQDPYVLDLTDGAGHGILIATDAIFFDVQQTGFTAAAVTTAKLIYRFKQVSLAEYIGIVQSQQ